MTGKCFICNRDIVLEPTWFTKNESVIGKVEDPVEGIAFTFSVGYGSRHDGKYGQIVICDDCFDDRIDRVHGLGDYLGYMTQEGD